MITTVADLYREYEELCGQEGPQRTMQELKDEFYYRFGGAYEENSKRFFDEIFKDEWAWGIDTC